MRITTYRSFALILLLTILSGLAAPIVLAETGGQVASQSSPGAPPNEEAGEESLQAIFAGTAAEFGVPVDLLIATAWTRSHMRSQISVAGEYGLMQLPTENPNLVAQAAQLLGETEAKVKTDNRCNVRGAAALLRKIAGEKFPDRAELTPAEWYDVLVTFSTAGNSVVAETYAQQVFKLLGEGLTVQVDGETLVVNPWPDAQKLIRKSGVTILSDDYPPAHWIAAHPSNYTSASRGTDQIDMIVIHVMQGYYGAIGMFTQPNKGASAHYFVRSSDGDVTQMVRDEDIAWHAGHWETNQRSIGIEHEGFMDDASWYTEAMYQSSANLVRHLADKYGIPKDRAHIIGHVEVPGCPYNGGGRNCHTDPGPYWDWDHFMNLVTSGDCPPGDTMVKVSGPSTVSVGQVFTASVLVCNAEAPGVFGGQYRLGFDGACLQGIASSLHPGTDLGSDPILAVKNIDNAAGQVSFGVSRRGDMPNIAGDMVLGTVSFVATNPTSSVVISLHDVKLGAKGGVVVPFSNTVDLALSIKEGEKLAVTGRVEMEGRETANWDGAEVSACTHRATTGDDGAFTLGAGEGTCDIKAEAAGYLPSICRDVSLIKPMTALANPARLLAGDINGDGAVDIKDAAAIGADFGKSGAGLVTDLNKDGGVEIFDLILLGGNFGKTTQDWDCQPGA